MVLNAGGLYDDDDEELQPQPSVEQRPPAPPQLQPQPRPMAQPSSAPAVPKELLSARPAMTRVVPRSPEKLAQMQAAQNKPATPVPPAPTPQEIAERKERIEYLRNLRDTGSKPKKKKGGKKWLLVLLLLVVLAGLGGGGYWFMAQKNKATPAKSTATTTQPQQQTAPATTPEDTTADMKDYQAKTLPVALKYPSDWTISDTAAKLTITSPQQSLTSPTGEKVNGQVVVTIRPKQATLDEFKAGNAAAVLASKRLSYSQPAAGQRDSTYISYLQYAKTTSKGALDAIYVTGNAGYQKGQFVPQTDVVKVDPLITVSFVSCTGPCAASTAPPTSVEAASWAASPLNTAVENILKSLAIS